MENGSYMEAQHVTCVLPTTMYHRHVVSVMVIRSLHPSLTVHLEAPLVTLDNDQSYCNLMDLLPEIGKFNLLKKTLTCTYFS